MMHVIWTANAETDLRSIAEFVSDESLDYAIKLFHHLRQAGDSLAMFPQKGRIGRQHGVRELVAHEHYIIMYELNQDAILITAIVHTSRMWPPS